MKDRLGKSLPKLHRERLIMKTGKKTFGIVALIAGVILTVVSLNAGYTPVVEASHQNTGSFDVFWPTSIVPLPQGVSGGSFEVQISPARPGGVGELQQMVAMTNIVFPFPPHGLTQVTGFTETSAFVSFTDLAHNTEAGAINPLFFTLQFDELAGGFPSVSIFITQFDDDNGDSIAAGEFWPVNLEIDTTSYLAVVSGTVELQFRTPTSQGGIGHSSASVKVVGNGFDSGDVSVNPDGTFEIAGVPSSGTYTITASAPGHLEAELASLVLAGEDVDINTTTLIAGDVDTSGFVSIDDITAVTASFGQNVTGCVDSSNRVVDLDCSGFVSIDDVTGTIANFGKSSPQAWSE